MVISSLSSLASEERDIINHIQLLTERITQLENSFTSSQAAIEEVSSISNYLITRVFYYHTSSLRIKLIRFVACIC